MGTSDVERLVKVSAFLSREAQLVDQKRWTEWLELFDEQCEFWAPAWDSDTVLTKDPEREVSLIYYQRRAGLEDRVYRIEHTQAPSAVPPPRTSHLVSAIDIVEAHGGVVRVAANWVCHWIWQKDARTYFGRYDYELRETPGALADFVIQKKRIVVNNDVIPTVLDIWHI